ncbi:hypothetical protein JHL18_16130 [Clostridium sp. YIM B02505]|uniref:Uncharacterized protein n=1 Tax=Clostridium yunnanense TaxID=2800325 RepID=A0ABS1ERY8_9CLOT|nr:hypothetical protein [Clostridium yunnanense]MBK1812152.1 hypothetical protein [Clostridium yunnanense]
MIQPYDFKYAILIEIFKRADGHFEKEVQHNLTSSTAPDQILEYFDYYAKYNDLVGIDIMKQLYTSNNKMFTETAGICSHCFRKL